MKDLVKTLKENFSAVITALSILMVVLYYLFSVVPNHQVKLDAYNYTRIHEFNRQFNSAIRDYANQLTPAQFKEIYDRTNIKGKGGISHKDVLNNIIVDEFAITSLTQYSDSIRFGRRIKCHNRITGEPTILNDTEAIAKQELKSRIKGAITFPYWMIYENSKFDLIETDKHVFLNNDIDIWEIDSLISKKTSGAYVKFKDSNKRFYKLPVVIDGAEINLMLVGAVSSADFDSEARDIDVYYGMAAIILVLLLFLGIPLLKPVISSAKEKLTQFDLINVSLCIWLGCIIMSVYIVSVYFTKMQNEQVNDKLVTLNNRVSKNLLSEFEPYKRLLSDTFFKKPRVIHFDTNNVSPDFKKRWKFLFNDSSNLIAFKMSTVNEQMSCEVVRDAKNFSIIKKYGDRDYFKRLRHQGYNCDFTAVFSKTTNLYELVYAEKIKGTSEIVGLAYVPTFRKYENDRLDEGYGYLLCDKDGKVILHNDASKSLNENLYKVCHEPHDLLKVLRGCDKSFFELNYNGAPTAAYSQELDYSTDKQFRVPVHLITFKKLNYEGKLHIHIVLNAVLLSMTYAIGISILLLVYSAVLYYGHVSFFSKSHLYWLFPDKSRKTEYRFLTWFNYVGAVIIIVLCFCNPQHVFFILLLIGLNLAFINFILLTQRAWFLKFSHLGVKRFLLSLATHLLIAAILSTLFYINSYPAFALLFCVLAHIMFIIKLRKQTITPFSNLIDASAKKNKKNSYINYINSGIHYHYILVPIIIASLLYYIEFNNVDKYNRSHRAHHSPINYQGWNSKTNLLSEMLPVSPPSNEILKNSSFDYLKGDTLLNNTLTSHLISGSSEKTVAAKSFSDVLYRSGNFDKLVLLIFYILLFTIVVFTLVSVFTGRFFFFELVELYRIHFSNNKHRFINEQIILPPYSSLDLKTLQTSELFGKDTGGYSPVDITINIASKKKIIELIYFQTVKTNHEDYRNIWASLSEEEKFVLRDFASDYFVNYKNREILIELMKSQLIIADPLTWRLRLMNYSFRKFISTLSKSTSEVEYAETIEKLAGNFAKWRVPLLIIAFSFLLIMVYLFRESYDKIILLGGSVISSIALVAKFMNNYK